MTKQCAKCKQELPLETYRIVGNYVDGTKRRGNVCRTCYNDKVRKDKKKTRETWRTYEKRYVNKKRQWYYNYLKTQKCADCGISDPIVLEFDHNDPATKVKAVSAMAGGRGSIDVLKAEIAKCTVRCANCHRKVTARQQHWFEDLK